jgi:alcohol dehydrogenase class IV
MKPFKCLLPTGVSFGPGKIRGLADLVKSQSVLVLSDKGVTQSGLADRALDLCRANAAGVFENLDVPTEPSEDQVADVVAKVDGREVGVIVAVGGGSVMDVAKLVAVMINGGPSIAALLDGFVPEARRARLVMLPTTAGTGSEATPNAIVYRPRQALKVGIVRDAFMPDQVILDPELLTRLPPAITASTGLDALCHALECLVSNKANALSDLFATEALRLIFKSLRKTHADGKNIEARGEMLLAAFYAGICIASSGTNAVHALSYPLGGKYRIAHGVSNAVLLAPCFAWNKDACAGKLAMAAELAAGAQGVSLAGKSDMEKAGYLVDYLAQLSRALGIPASLEELGIPLGDLDALADAAFEVKRLLDNNPKPLGRADIKAIYAGILGRS